MRSKSVSRWSALSDMMIPIAAIAVLFIAWQVSVAIFAIPVYILPSPSAIWLEAVPSAPILFGHTLVTIRTVLLGFVLSLVVSLPIAMLLAASDKISRVLYPILILTQSVPKVALAPILIIVLGGDELPRVIVTFLVVFFPLVVATVTGLTATPPEYIELGRSVRASQWKIMCKIRLPYAVPFIFGGLKVATALAVVGAVVGEFVSANAGLGYLIVTSMAFFKGPLAWAAMIILSAIGIGFFHLVSLAEAIFFPWSRSDSH